MSSFSKAALRLLIVIVAAAGFAACGGSDAGGGGGDAAQPQIRNAGGTAADDRPRDGTPSGGLFSADGEPVPQIDVGSKRAKDRLVDMLAETQRDVRAGNLMSVCRKMTRGWPAGKRARPHSACEQALAELRGSSPAGEPVTYAVISVRVYEYSGIGGIWVSDGRAKPFRVPFSRERGRWSLDFGVFEQSQVLNGRLHRGK